MTRFVSFSSDGYTDVDGYSIKIIGSRLAEFIICGYSLPPDTTVVSASLSCPWYLYPKTYAQSLGELGLQARRLLRQISSSQYLELPSCVLESKYIKSFCNVGFAVKIYRLVVEHGLGHLPFTEKPVITPTVKSQHNQIKIGESMENALRACCKGIKIGKILIHREGDNGQPLLSCNSAVQVISLLIQKGVPECNIIFLNLISAPQGVHVVCKRYPRLKIVTSEIEIGLNDDYRVIPGMGEFGDRYFGTNDD